MSIADFRSHAVSGPYALGPDARLVPLDRKKVLRARIKAMLREKAVIAQVRDAVECRNDAEMPLWVHALDGDDRPLYGSEQS